jgi:hypothetical protein
MAGLSLATEKKSHEKITPRKIGRLPARRPENLHSPAFFLYGVDVCHAPPAGPRSLTAVPVNAR